MVLDQLRHLVRERHDAEGQVRGASGQEGRLLARSFDKKILCKIMGENYLKSRAHSVAWDNTVLEMQAKKVHLMNFFSGVIHSRGSGTKNVLF